MFTKTRQIHHKCIFKLTIDLLLHVVDVTHVNAIAQAEAVAQTLEDIGVVDLPMLTVMNKVDLLQDGDDRPVYVRDAFPGAIEISALKGLGIGELLEAIAHELFENMSPLVAFLPYKEGGLISTFHEHGIVDRSENQETGILLEGSLPNRMLAQYRRFRVSDSVEDEEPFVE